MHELLVRWQRGWSLSRGWMDYDETDGVIVVRVGEPDREVEYLTTPAYAARAARLALTTPGTTRLTVLASDPDAVAKSIHPLTVRAIPRIMTIPLADHPHHPIPPEYELHLTAGPTVIRAELHHAGEPVASGHLALHGSDAVPDLIHTEPAHRRRGLAAALMTALTTQARTQGATTGLLAASPEGQFLYDALGWTPSYHLVFATT